MVFKDKAYNGHAYLVKTCKEKVSKDNASKDNCFKGKAYKGNKYKGNACCGNECDGKAVKGNTQNGNSCNGKLDVMVRHIMVWYLRVSRVMKMHIWAEMSGECIIGKCT
jgi:hypothetical protein